MTMTTTNALLARFDNAPILYDEDAGSTLVANLHHAFELAERISAANDNGEIQMRDGFWPDPDHWLATYRPYNVKDGILSIPVKGVLLNDFAWADGEYATGYVYIRKAIERGMADPEVHGIAFVINSGGGEVAGNFDLADDIYALRSKKPMRAFASEHAYSAAYSIASATDRIIVARTGGVGSIGVVTSRMDYSEALDKAGIKVHLIHYGKQKVDSYSTKPLSKEAKERIQARVDELGEIFVATVARNRSMDADVIRATEAGVFTASQATSNGLADEIGSLDDSVAAFAAELSNRRKGKLTMSGQTTTEKTVDQAAVDAARAEGHAAGKLEGIKEGTKAAFDRINSILASDAAKTRPVMALKMAVGEKFAALDAATVTEMLGELPEEKAEAKQESTTDTNATGKNFKEEMNSEKPTDHGHPGGADEANGMTRAQKLLAQTKGPVKTTA
jgi:signal peptide peptidase SppA